MSAKITKFYPKNAADNPDAVLDQSIGQYESVVTIGWNKDGSLDVRASTNLSHTDINWLITVFQNKLVNGDYSL